MSTVSCTQVQSISGYMPEYACHVIVIYMTVIYHNIPSIIKFITVYLKDELCMGWYVTFRIPCDKPLGCKNESAS